MLLYICWYICLMYYFSLFFSSTVSAASNEVSQTPPRLFRKDGESAELWCSHDISSYNRILWYKQTGHRQLKLMGTLVATQPQPETEQVEDTALYFCAASYAQWYISLIFMTKTQF
uniref:Ig-like domain-containing protein n=1 Tax=Astyanax mexicanus TaxID=7994 RepID=A0A8B9L3B7_ASTMX